VAPAASPEPAEQRSRRNRAVSGQSRSRGGNPPVGRAVPRSGRPPIRGGTVYVPYYRSYPYGYYGYGYPYGYGAFGLGYFYYDPFYYGYSGYGYGGSGYGGYGYGRGRHYGYDLGGLRLKVKPREAQVFIDGYYVGLVDDYDGVFQRLNLDTGPHRVEIRADGYEPLIFEVRIVPGDTITYRGELQRVP
jgi:hypothetical protein